MRTRSTDDFDRSYDRDLDRDPTFGRRARIALNERGAVRMETLARQTRGHGAMCPCNSCRELRSL